MSLLLSIGSIFDDTVVYGLEQVWSIRSDPAWLTFGLCFLIGSMGLAALAFLYPLARD